MLITGYTYSIYVRERGLTRIMITQPDIHGGMGMPIDYLGVADFLKDWDSVLHKKLERSVQELLDAGQGYICESTGKYIDYPF